MGISVVPNEARVVVLTGAGISRESGLKTFRDADGLWEGCRVEEVATPEAFAADPATVLRFYNERRRQLGTVHPNAAHRALAKFEASCPGTFTLVTQNVDDLHERAGSRRIIHMHGQLRQARCLLTDEVFDWQGDLDADTPHPRHPDDPARRGQLRPHICWFGEVPFAMEAIQAAVAQADVFVAIGTSGLVYPAAGLVRWTPHHCRRVLLNLDPADNSAAFDDIIHGPATETVPALFQASEK